MNFVNILVITDEGKAQAFWKVNRKTIKEPPKSKIQDLLSKTVSDNTVTGAESPKVETESKISNDKIKELKKKKLTFKS